MDEQRDILLVCGCTRSGMSLTMQMLDRGGFPVYGTYPSYEDAGFGIFPACSDMAVKIPDPWHVNIPLSRVRVIYCRRNAEDQARSMVRFLNATRLGIPPIPEGKIVSSILADDERMLNLLSGAGVPRIVQWFRGLVEQPRQAAKRIARFAGRDLDIEAMAGAVIKRGGGLHPTLLEPELLEMAAAMKAEASECASE